jgi:hypothetical protein
LGSIALGFESHVIEGPDCTWSDLELEFHRLKRGLGLAILAWVAMPANLGLRTRVMDALEVGEHRRRITDANLRGYKKSRPGWIADRISCLVLATEILRLFDHQGAAIERVRRELERHPASQRLVDECRALRPCGIRISATSRLRIFVRLGFCTTARGPAVGGPISLKWHRDIPELAPSMQVIELS